MQILVILAAAVYGVFAGLLLPRVVYKMAVPPDQAWRDLCPAGHPVPAWVGIPHCRACPGDGSTRSTGGEAFGPSTAIVISLTVTVCAALAYATGPRPELAVWLMITPALLLLALVDFTVHRLPDVVTLPLTALTVLLLGAAALVPTAGGSWATALSGAFALGGGYFILFLVSPRSLGFGDVKLAFPLGAVLGWHGWSTLVLGAIAGQLLAALYGLALIALRRARMKSSIPYGPFLIGGTLVGMLVATASNRA
ncbi:A24 family peptidase [Streptomyces sp. ASQP_92]|uniref:prepilin peptidase n=1 Tax=Streptomyces sp. ASQP_92 TaxID=2979116 RepID=UPI0021C03E48|nr:A24 family peptidase [Streptomyces sp. ASQP_92]MCT9093949.1 A24 family peptidase [Streptomyces sp. ASQP_92]